MRRENAACWVPGRFALGRERFHGPPGRKEAPITKAPDSGALTAGDSTGRQLTPREQRTRLKVSRVTSALYYNISSTVTDPIGIQFVATHAGEGTSLIAAQFASFAASVEGGSALLIDCSDGQRTPSGPPTLAEAFSRSARIDDALTPVQPGLRLDAAVLSNHPNSILHTDPVALGSVLDQTRSRYRVTVLDTPAIEDTPGTLAFSRACDGVVLVLEAERTTQQAAQAAIDAIERSGGKLIGLIFNKRRMHVPRWLRRKRS